MKKEEFKNRVKNFRKSIENLEETGYLKDEILEELELLLEVEKSILDELIPYFREISIGSTTFIIKPIKKLGEYQIATGVEESIRIRKNIFLILTVDKELYIMIIDDFNLTVEFKLYIKNSLKNIYFIKLIKNRIYLISTNNEVYSVCIEDILLNTPNKVNKIGLNLNVFENVFEFREKTYFISGNEKNTDFYKFDLKKGFEFKKSLKIIDVKNILIVSNNVIILNTRYHIYILDEKFNIVNIVELYKKINYIEKSYGEILVIMENEIVIYHFENNMLEFGYKIIVKEPIYKIELIGEIAILISELGNLFLIEKNFNKWSLNCNLYIEEDTIFALNYDEDSYYIVDLNGELKKIIFNRLKSYEDLEKIRLY